MLSGALLTAARPSPKRKRSLSSPTAHACPPFAPPCPPDARVGLDSALDPDDGGGDLPLHPGQASPHRSIASRFANLHLDASLPLVLPFRSPPGKRAKTAACDSAAPVHLLVQPPSPLPDQPGFLDSSASLPRYSVATAALSPHERPHERLLHIPAPPQPELLSAPPVALPGSPSPASSPPPPAGMAFFASPAPPPPPPQPAAALPTQMSTTSTFMTSPPTPATTTTATTPSDTAMSIESCRPRRNSSPPPPPTALFFSASEITGHLISLDPEDDGTGINGVGFKPSPALAWARAQRRRQQVQDWKTREAREARRERMERRRGHSIATSSSVAALKDSERRRMVRFA